VIAVPQMQRTPGRHVTRRLEPPRITIGSGRAATTLAEAMATAHNTAVREYGSDCGGFHAFNPDTRTSAGVWDGVGSFPRVAVITPLSWGRIDATLAQRLLEADCVETGVAETRTD
jgi:hypothetical protein